MKKRTSEGDNDHHHHPPSCNIPNFISKVPWYHKGGDGNDSSGKGMEHQSKKKVAKTPLTHHHEKGQTERKTKKWKEGSCSNCGSATHTNMDCVENPRKRGAEVTRTSLAKDDWVKNASNLDWDAKRDRWATFDATEKAEKKAKTPKKQKENPFKLENIDMSLRVREDRASYLDSGDSVTATATGTTTTTEKMLESVKTEFVSKQEDTFSWEIKKEKSSNKEAKTNQKKTLTLLQKTANKVDPSLLDGY